MIQCHDCQYFRQEPNCRPKLLCNPYENIVEPECLMKWQIFRLETLIQSYEASNLLQMRMAPLQDKILKYIKREIKDIDESEKWKSPDFLDNLNDVYPQDDSEDTDNPQTNL